MAVRFVKLHFAPDGTVTETPIKEIEQEKIAKCPHTIFVAEHYNDDGTCRCSDPDAKEMAEWGYEWRDGQWRTPCKDDTSS